MNLFSRGYSKKGASIGRKGRFLACLNRPLNWAIARFWSMVYERGLCIERLSCFCHEFLLKLIPLVNFFDDLHSSVVNHVLYSTGYFLPFYFRELYGWIREGLLLSWLYLKIGMVTLNRTIFYFIFFNIKISQFPFE